MNKELLQEILRKSFDKSSGLEMVKIYNLICSLHNVHQFNDDWLKELRSDYEFELNKA